MVPTRCHATSALTSQPTETNAGTQLRQLKRTPEHNSRLYIESIGRAVALVLFTACVLSDLNEIGSLHGHLKTISSSYNFEEKYMHQIFVIGFKV
jgi:hypothetical protein